MIIGCLLRSEAEVELQSTATVPIAGPVFMWIRASKEANRRRLGSDDVRDGLPNAIVRRRLPLFSG